MLPISRSLVILAVFLALLGGSEPVLADNGPVGWTPLASHADMSATRGQVLQLQLTTAARRYVTQFGSPPTSAADLLAASPLLYIPVRADGNRCSILTFAEAPGSDLPDETLALWIHDGLLIYRLGPDMTGSGALRLPTEPDQASLGMSNRVGLAFQDMVLSYAFMTGHLPESDEDLLQTLGFARALPSETGALTTGGPLMTVRGEVDPTTKQLRTTYAGFGPPMVIVINYEFNETTGWVKTAGDIERPTVVAPPTGSSRLFFEAELPMN